MMLQEFRIGEHTVGHGRRPFVIAEMSGNHNQSLERALALVDAAADAGAHALKLQTYTADTITMEGVHRIEDKGSLWYGKELHGLYKDAYTPWEWHGPIFEHARKRGLVPFSSPFDETSVDFLLSLDVPVFKIASFENTHHPLLRKVARTGKPVIMSTGVATLADLEESVAVLKDAGCRALVLLKCTSTYPASPEDTNLATIPDLRARFGVPVGLSDHTMGVGVSVAATTYGVAAIEKHFTLRRADGGVDSAFSLEPEELRSLVVETGRAWQAIGKVSYGLGAKEKNSLVYKRSVFVSADIKAGETFTAANVKVIRPADGLHPRYYEVVLGRTAARDLKRGTPLKAEDVVGGVS